MDRVITKSCIFNVPKETLEEDGSIIPCEEYCRMIDGHCDECPIQKSFDKLKHYEDLEEQGLLPRFHLGDEFWTTMIDRVVKAKVVMLQQKKDGSWIYRLSCEITKDYHDTINYEERKYGKCFFETKEEAEAKLKELENE